MRIFLLGLLCSLFCGVAQAEKPNVVIFFIDDLGYKDLGCYGSTFYETPNIDALAKRSVRFTDFYSANPVCSPTRAALMTGKAPQRVGITQWIPQPDETHLPLSELTIGEAFAAAGYQTGYIGKWHLGEKDEHLPTAQGFQWMRSVNRAGQPASYFHPFAGRKQKGIGYWDIPDLAETKPGDYLTDKITDHALEFISGNQDKPFLLCLAHYAVHTPIQSPPALVEKYAAKKTQTYGETNSPLGDERNDSKTRTRQDDPAYAAMVENLDTNVGRVLEHLDKLGLSQNTIVVFTSDNGGLTTTGNAGPTAVKPLRAGKGWTYEGGIRIPTLFYWPEKIQPGVCTTPAITMDIYPTLLELAGLASRPEQHLDGASLVSALQGNPDENLQSRFLAWTYPHKHGSGHTPSNALRAGDWKLIHRSDQDRYELYNLKDDVSETKNLANSLPDKTDELAKQLADWVTATQPVESR